MLRWGPFAKIASGLSRISQRLKTPGFVLLAIAIMISSYHVYRGIVEIKALGLPYEKATLSGLGLDIVPLDMRLRNDSHKRISEYALWDLPVPEVKSSLAKGDNSGDQPISYAQKPFNGIHAVYRKSDEKYRWELHGLIASRSVREAVFFNPALDKDEQRGWYRFKAGDVVDNDLVLEHIGDEEVFISFKKEQLDFQLELFLISSPWKE